MTKQKDEITIEMVKKEAARFDPTMSENEKQFQAAVCMLASLKCGPDEKKIAEFTGEARESHLSQSHSAMERS